MPSIKSIQADCGLHHPLVKAGAISFFGVVGGIALRQFGFYRLSWGLIGTALFVGGLAYGHALRARKVTQAPQKFDHLFPGDHLSTSACGYFFYRQGLTNENLSHLNTLLLKYPCPQEIARDRVVAVQLHDNPQISSVDEVVKFVNGIDSPVELTLSGTGFDLKAMVEICQRCEKLETLCLFYEQIEKGDHETLQEIKGKKLVVYMRDNPPEGAQEIVQALEVVQSNLEIAFLDSQHETVACYPKSAIKPRKVEQPVVPGITGAYFVDKKEKRSNGSDTTLL